MTRAKTVKALCGDLFDRAAFDAGMRVLRQWTT